MVSRRPIPRNTGQRTRPRRSYRWSSRSSPIVWRKCSGGPSPSSRPTSIPRRPGQRRVGLPRRSADTPFAVRSRRRRDVAGARECLHQEPLATRRRQRPDSVDHPGARVHRPTPRRRGGRGIAERAELVDQRPDELGEADPLRSPGQAFRAALAEPLEVSRWLRDLDVRGGLSRLMTWGTGESRRVLCEHRSPARRCRWCSQSTLRDYDLSVTSPNAKQNSCHAIC